MPEANMSQQCSWLFTSMGSASVDSTNSVACDWLNLGMQSLWIQSISWDPFGTTVLSFWGFWYLQKVLEPIFHRYQGKTVYFYMVIKIFFAISFYILPTLKLLTPPKYIIFLRFWANELMNWNEAWNIPFNFHQDSLELVLLRVLLYK